MVDDEFNREEWIDALGVAADFVDCFAHCGEIDDRGNAGEILQQNARRHESDFFFFGAGGPRGERLNVTGVNEPAVFTAEEVFEQDAEGKRQFIYVPDVLFFENFEALDVEGLCADVQLVTRSERVCHRDGHLVFLSGEKEQSMITEVLRRVQSPDSNAGVSDAILEKS